MNLKKLPSLQFVITDQMSLISPLNSNDRSIPLIRVYYAIKLGAHMRQEGGLLQVGPVIIRQKMPAWRGGMSPPPPPSFSLSHRLTLQTPPPPNCTPWTIIGLIPTDAKYMPGLFIHVLLFSTSDHILAYSVLGLGDFGSDILFISFSDLFPYYLIESSFSNCLCRFSKNIYLWK